MHAFDGQTDRQTEFSSVDRVCIEGARCTSCSGLFEVANVCVNKKPTCDFLFVNNTNLLITNLCLDIKARRMNTFNISDANNNINN